ncbi:helix-hairpin-helix domain-containing protein [Erwinia pyri]|uniref:Uncharacterized protein YbaV n=1 Tax=Erwinia pyri TaxID=3062598 RepID=A0AA50DKT2_9GAMM|nr:helix-hairpin-helix domain-containing protein [Erwinia sp. DE2]WLS78001.1 helix-hairpin-helix domain-containing protein [Erwinia sp. DE2]
MQNKLKALCFTMMMSAGTLAALPVKSAEPAPASSQVSIAADKEAAARISLNQASAEELAAALNGVGIKKAEAIVSYREQYGDFTAIEQLKEVPGIGNALVERNLSRLKL